MRELAKQFIEHYYANPHKRESALEDVRALGQAEIEASTKVKVIDLGLGYKMYAQRIQEIINPSRWQSFKRKMFLGSCIDGEQLDLDNGLGVMQLSLKKLIANQTEIRKHIRRVDIMRVIVANLAEENGRYEVSNDDPAYEIAQRQQTITTHLAVLHQAELAVAMLIEATARLVDAAQRTLNTYALAKRVNEQVNEYVHEISQNNALALESGTSERRPSHSKFIGLQGP